MQSRRDYAASLGLAIAGARGKFSNAAKEAIAKAESEGMKFSDTPTGPTMATSTDVDKSVKPKPAGVPDYIAPSEYRYPEGEWTVKPTGPMPYGIKSVGLRSACETCGLSLLDHRCDAPIVFGVPVTIVPGKG